MYISCDGQGQIIPKKDMRLLREDQKLCFFETLLVSYIYSFILFTYVFSGRYSKKQFRNFWICILFDINSITLTRRAQQSPFSKSYGNFNLNTHKQLDLELIGKKKRKCFS